MAFPLPFHFVLCEHPYVVEGNKYAFYSHLDKDGAFYLRVDLPGICQETVRAWADKDNVYFEGVDAKNDKEFDKKSPRKFKGNLPLFSDDSSLEIDKLKYVVKDGVLKVKIPQAEPAAWRLDVPQPIAVSGTLARINDSIRKTSNWF